MLNEMRMLRYSRYVGEMDVLNWNILVLYWMWLNAINISTLKSKPYFMAYKINRCTTQVCIYCIHKIKQSIICIDNIEFCFGKYRKQIQYFNIIQNFKWIAMTNEKLNFKWSPTKRKNILTIQMEQLNGVMVASLKNHFH